MQHLREVDASPRCIFSLNPGKKQRKNDFMAGFSNIGREKNHVAPRVHKHAKRDVEDMLDSICLRHFSKNPFELVLID